MNDRFKFRIWNKKFKKYLGDDSFFMIDQRGILKCNNRTQPINCYIVESCTGLKDIQGTLMYENDIVEHNHYHLCEDLYVLEDSEFHKIVFNDERARFETSEDCYYELDHFNHGSALKIIGNIHKNPELLER